VQSGQVALPRYRLGGAVDDGNRHARLLDCEFLVGDVAFQQAAGDRHTHAPVGAAN
jgi:hypothetical protein